MNERDLSRILQEEPIASRENVAAILAPDIARNAARLKKRRRDRMMMIVFLVIAAIFVAAAVVFALALSRAENPETCLRPALFVLLGGMGLTLMMSPMLTYLLESEN